MKHHDPARPVGKCKGCCLNAKTTCLAGLEPRAAWSRHGCRLYDDHDTLLRVQTASPPTGAKAALATRRQKALSARATPHHDGHIFAPARARP